jgi:hypothetical protein
MGSLKRNGGKCGACLGKGWVWVIVRRASSLHGGVTLPIFWWLALNKTPVMPAVVYSVGSNGQFDFEEAMLQVMAASSVRLPPVRRAVYLRL